jgi:TolA-binding protein
VRNFLILVVLIVVGVKMSVDYFFSPDFQEYANRTKAPWTCTAENVAGQMNMVMSHYRAAQQLFSHTIARCPDTPMAEEAEFENARALEGMGFAHDASVAYSAFIEKHPTSPRARTADRAVEMLHAS